MKARTGISAVALAALMSGAAVAGAAAAEDCVGTPSDTSLTVEVTGLRSAAGEVAITVYPDDPDRWLAPHGKLERARVPTTAPTTKACFWLPGPGYYAIAVYHDANGDHAFDRGLGGPAEGFGVSNDAPANGGLPEFRAARFRVKPGHDTTSLRMTYPE